MTSVLETDREFGDGGFTTMVHRVQLIEELRSVRFHQGRGSLFTIGYNSRRRNYVPGERAHGEYCCIGVGVSLCGMLDHEMHFDPQDGYSIFNDVYGIGDKEQRYLIGMNDGEHVRWPISDSYGQTYGTGSRMIRVHGNRRTFHQIARFLEIIWGLTP